MATRGLNIGRNPVNITSHLSLVDGKRYVAQNTANGGGAVLYLAEIDSTSPNPIRGDAALEIHIDTIITIEARTGLDMWVWCGVDGGRLVVSESV